MTTRQRRPAEVEPDSLAELGADCRVLRGRNTLPHNPPPPRPAPVGPLSVPEEAVRLAEGLSPYGG